MKYLYQRNNGIITKYEQLNRDIRGGNIYIDKSTGIAVDKNEVLLLGKVSESAFDILETDDFAILEYYVSKYKKRIERRFEVFKTRKLIAFNNAHCDFLYDLSKQEFLDGKGFNIKIKSIVTKESFASVEYKIEEEQWK